MINKRLPFLTMFFIGVLYVIFRMAYNGVFDPQNIITVIALLGFLIAIGVNFLIGKFMKKKETQNE